MKCTNCGGDIVDPVRVYPVLHYRCARCGTALGVLEGAARNPRPGGARCRSGRLRKKRRKHAETLAAVYVSIMKHPFDQWSSEEKLRLKSKRIRRICFGPRRTPPWARDDELPGRGTPRAS